jgi:hypothetical protein
VRERIAQKRGGARPPLTLSNGLGAPLPDAQQTVLAVREAREALEQADATLAATFRFAVFGHGTGSSRSASEQHNCSDDDLRRDATRRDD